MPDGQEIIVAPFSVYLADIGTAYPEVDEDPAAAWGFLGDGGDKSQGEDGLVINSRPDGRFAQDGWPNWCRQGDYIRRGIDDQL